MPSSPVKLRQSSGGALLLPVLSGVILLYSSQYGFFSFQMGSTNALDSAGAGLLANDVQGNLALKIQRYAFYLVITLLLLPFYRRLLRQLSTNQTFILLPAGAALSVFWTQDVKATAISSCFILLDTLFAIYLIDRLTFQQLMQLFVITGTIAAVGSLIVVMVFPEYGLMHGRDVTAVGAWQGIYGQKNIAGTAFTFFLLPVFFIKGKARYNLVFRWIYTGILLLLIVMGRSLGTWVTCCLCLVFLWLLRKFMRLRSKDQSLGVFVGMLLASAGLYAVFTYKTALLRLVGKDPSLHGRTQIWAAVIPSIMKRILEGYGYMAFWQGPHGESGNVALNYGFAGLAYSESGVLDLCLSLGLVGLFLYLFLYFRAWRDALICFREHTNDRVLWAMTILFSVFVANTQGGKLCFPTDLQYVIPIIAFWILHAEVKQSRVGLSSERTAI